MPKVKCQCGCGGKYKAGEHQYKIDSDNILGLENPWNRPPNKDDLKLCKECWFEARNGHAITCTLHKKTC